jgi:hypothetical protein
MREFFNLQLISAPESQKPDRETDVKRGRYGSLMSDLRGWKSPQWVIAGARGLTAQNTSFTAQQLTLLSVVLTTRIGRSEQKNVTSIKFLIVT